jgi:hypothetical protein
VKENDGLGRDEAKAFAQAVCSAMATDSQAHKIAHGWKEATKEQRPE